MVKPQEKLRGNFRGFGIELYLYLVHENFSGALLKPKLLPWYFRVDHYKNGKLLATYYIAEGFNHTC